MRTPEQMDVHEFLSGMKRATSAGRRVGETRSPLTIRKSGEGGGGSGVSKVGQVEEEWAGLEWRMRTRTRRGKWRGRSMGGEGVEGAEKRKGWEGSRLGFGVRVGARRSGPARQHVVLVLSYKASASMRGTHPLQLCKPWRGERAYFTVPRCKWPS